MLLSKSIAVYLNLVACEFKKYTATMLKQGKVELTPEQFLLIDLLWNDGPMSQQKLADTMRKDKNSVTKLTDALERKGFVVRKRDEKDRRSNILMLTDKAQEAKLEAKETGISMLDKILEGIEEKDLQNFLETLQKMSKNMSYFLR